MPAHAGQRRGRGAAASATSLAVPFTNSHDLVGIGGIAVLERRSA